MQEKAVAELDPVLTKTGFTKAVEMMYEDMGTQMAKTLGVEKFGGNVQTSGVKKVGYSYWCTANKDMYRCKVENSLNYVDDAYFDAFSNASLLGKLKNLASNIDTGLGYLRIFNYISISGKVNLTNGTSTQVKYNHPTNGTIGVQLIASNPDCNYNKLTVVEESSLGFTIIHPNTYGTLAINYTAVCFL